MSKKEKYDNFPKRVRQHIDEDVSVTIFKESIPEDWVVRTISERDYGIDLIIEIVNDERMTGKLFTCQLKSIEKINKNLTCNKIKPSTFNYWYALPTTTFVFFVDLSKREVFYQNVKKYIRQNYSKFKEEKLKKITFDNKLSLSKILKTDIEKVLINEYNRENSLKHIENQMIAFLLNIEKNLNMLDSHLYRDPFLLLADSDNDDFEYILVYQQFKELYEYFNKVWNIRDLDDFYQEGIKMFSVPYSGIFYEAQASILSKELIPILIELYILISENIKKYKDYWRSEYLYFTVLFERKYIDLWKVIVEKMNYYDFLYDT